MRIVIDMQGAQAQNRNRGIGRYALSLALAVARNRGEHEVILALNGQLTEGVDHIREAFRDVLPAENIRLWYTPGATHEIEPANHWRQAAAMRIREAFLESLEPSVVLLSSLFEGLVDDAVTSIGAFNSRLPTATVLYDLIPLLNPELYLKDEHVARWYDGKLDQLRRSRQVLAISESSRGEAIDCLGFQADEVVNIGAAIDPHFRPLALDDEQSQALRSQYNIDRPFLLYTGGIDPRKNIDGLIKAYAALQPAIRDVHQLVIVCSIQPQEKVLLETLASKSGLRDGDIILTGFTPEQDLVALYNLCKAFVFPSLHEGFGLPALEAMACGKAVIGSNSSSLPEVIGLDEALFDPKDQQDFTRALKTVLTDEVYRQRLEAHAPRQAAKFSWDKSARLALQALEALHEPKTAVPLALPSSERRRLAYLSPLPPERSGISDYSAELIPELSRHYEIDVITDQTSIDNNALRSCTTQRSIAWFRKNWRRYDRVLYHFGNSAFHQHMFDLLEEIPGVVVLHDFYLANVAHYMDNSGYAPGFFNQSLYASHGYPALLEHLGAADQHAAIWKYPCNLPVLENALGVIVHSPQSKRLADEWYGEGFSAQWHHIPLLRNSSKLSEESKQVSRRELGLRDDNFIVCSFGLLGPTKLNHRLLDAWLASPMADDPRSILVFVGENHPGDYGRELQQKINALGHERVRITGWADAELFCRYLSAADVSVQLRTLSRGETSAAVLDCMNYGLPLVLNSNGSLIDVPEQCAIRLSDEFEDSDLTDAMVSLWRAPELRFRLGEEAKRTINTLHVPRTCASQYAEAIESFHSSTHNLQGRLINSLAELLPGKIDEQSLALLSLAIGDSLPKKPVQQQLLVDVSELVQRDTATGIQRVVRSIVKEWLMSPPAGYRVEPVYAVADRPGYLYARHFTLSLMGNPSSNALNDDPISFVKGDTFIGLDLQPHIVKAQEHIFGLMRQRGVCVQFVVYDLLLQKFPQFFQKGGQDAFQAWLEVISMANGAICISQSVAGELDDWLQEHHPERAKSLSIDWFHLGADIQHSATGNDPVVDNNLIERLRSKPSFLIVSTLEPRKGHVAALDAFEELWAQGEDVILVLVGKQGWMVDELCARIRAHTELGSRLFWLEGIADSYLEEVYAACTCLIAPSYGEGFGLPLIEAAQHNLPIVARDIPVFREVAGVHATYFNESDSDGLSSALLQWMEKRTRGQQIESGNMDWLTWKESAEMLSAAILRVKGAGGMRERVNGYRTASRSAHLEGSK